MTLHRDASSGVLLARYKAANKTLEDSCVQDYWRSHACLEVWLQGYLGGAARGSPMRAPGEPQEGQ